MWRRIAGGLTDARQAEIWNYLRPHLERRLAPAAPGKAAKPKGVQPESLDEMVRLAVSLEHLSPEDKSELGDWIAPHVTTPGPWAWSFGRLGARDESLRGRALQMLENSRAPESWRHLLTHIAPMDEADKARAFGDTLPVGLAA